MTVWKPGDRVIVRLPSKTPVRHGGPYHMDVHGTVRDIDSGSRSGVLVDLDEIVNGLQDCYATHGELVPEATTQETPAS